MKRSHTYPMNWMSVNQWRRNFSRTTIPATPVLLLLHLSTSAAQLLRPLPLISADGVSRLAAVVAVAAAVLAVDNLPHVFVAIVFQLESYVRRPICVLTTGRSVRVSNHVSRFSSAFHPLTVEIQNRMDLKSLRMRRREKYTKITNLIYDVSYAWLMRQMA